MNQKKSLLVVTAEEALKRIMESKDLHVSVSWLIKSMYLSPFRDTLDTKIKPPNRSVPFPRTALFATNPVMDFKIEPDPTLPKGTIELRGANGSFARIVNIKNWGDSDDGSR